ncbi:hypothetical protein NEIG_02533 [Nematocida sp. ERTm5]|nr:hypothetical protein NEIG_02533 [Nematocida sp. ERTm5]
MCSKSLRILLFLSCLIVAAILIITNFGTALFFPSKRNTHRNSTSIKEDDYKFVDIQNAYSDNLDQPDLCEHSSNNVEIKCSIKENSSSDACFTETACSSKKSSAIEQTPVADKETENAKDLSPTRYISGQIEQTGENASYNPKHTVSLEKKELLEVLDKIAEKNIPLAGTAHYSDRIIDEIIIYKNEIVIVNIRVSGDLEEITLWEVLQTCSKDIDTHKGLKKKSSIKESTVSYPILIKYIPIIAHSILTYYSSCEIDVNSIVLYGFIFTQNEDIFEQYKIFSSIKTLTLKNTTIYSSTLYLLSRCIALKEICFDVGTDVKVDTTAIASIPNLEKLKLYTVNKKNVPWMLSIANFCTNLKEINITEIDFMNTAGLNSLINLEKITILTLMDIVFDGIPDFSFLKKMRALQKLIMIRIFYSYTNEFMQKELTKIKITPRYLNPTIDLDGSLMQKEEEDVLSKSIIEENRTVGAHISSNIVRIDSKLYNDLGMCKINPKKKSEYAIAIIFAEKLNERSWMNSVEIEFSLDDTMQNRLDIRANSIIVVKSAILKYIESISFPFLHIKTIKEISLTNSFKAPYESNMIDIFFSQIFTYTKHNNIKKLHMLSLIYTLHMDTYMIITIGNSMLDLNEIYLVNVLFEPTNTKPKNSNEEHALNSYAAYIQTAYSFMFKCRLI